MKNLHPRTSMLYTDKKKKNTEEKMGNDSFYDQAAKETLRAAAAKLQAKPKEEKEVRPAPSEPAPQDQADMPVHEHVASVQAPEPPAPPVAVQSPQAESVDSDFGAGEFDDFDFVSNKVFEEELLTLQRTQSQMANLGLGF